MPDRPPWLGDVPPIVREIHFGGRDVKCFSPRPASVHALFAHAARRQPGRLAIIGPSARISYGELEALVGQAAGRLERLGIGRGDRVALLLGNGAGFPIAFLAIQRLGAIAVPINIREQAPGIAYVLAMTEAKVVVHEASLAERLPTVGAADTPSGRVAIGQTGPDDFGSLVDCAHEVHVAAPAAEEATAVILFTSGTTGRPKGAMLTHLGLIHSALHYVAGMGLRDGEVSQVAVPMSHVTGIGGQVLPMLAVAGTLVLMPAFSAPAFIASAASERLTHTIMVPAMYNLLLREPSLKGCDLSRWRIGGYGGAPMAPETIARLGQQFPGLALMNIYGATETTSPVTMMPPSETARRPDSVGVALPCTEIRIVDEDGRDVNAGEPGEVWLKGPSVVPGYWRNPQATAESFNDGFWRSGDVGTLDAEGYLRVFDRKKDMINRGGYKVYSVEVENVLLGCPGVLEAAVIAGPCPVLGERVHAVVNVDPALYDEAATRERCRIALADYKVPETLVVHDGPLPRNAGGKLLKRVLREAFGLA